MAAGAPFIAATADGLHCADADLWIDPWRPVPRAVITHAHADHARPGMGSYLCSTASVPLLRARLGDDARIEGLAYGERRSENGVELSLHPASHVLGAAQVRLAGPAGVWVVSGDYRVEPDRTTTPFEPVPCDTFITESTFGLPLYRWRPQAEIVAGIAAWWRANAAAGRCSVLGAYSLGKSQRLLAALGDLGVGPIAAHGAVLNINRAYAAAGVDLPACAAVDDDLKPAGTLVLCPPAALGSTWMRRLGDTAVGMASGWMHVRGQRRRRNIAHGFAFSDHADWPGLLSAIRATGATEVLVTHGQVPPLVRWLEEHGTRARPLATGYGQEEEP